MGMITETTLAWNIVGLDRRTDDDMVIRVSWHLEGRNGPHYYSVQGTVVLKPSEDPIPFIDLTEELAVDWIHQTLGAESVETIENGVKCQLAALTNPSTLNGTPW